MKIITLIAAGLIGFSTTSHTFAAGSGGGTSTTKKCKSGKIYDKKLKKCVVLKSATDDALYETAMGLAYRGQYETAIDLLKRAQNQDAPRVLNYLGFSHRKLGRNKEAMVFYARALEANPNYILARSYMGQGLVSDGDLDGAKAQLVEISARGGEKSWAYRMLDNAITSGMTF